MGVVGVRAGLDGGCNLLTGSWERASHHRHLFLRSSPSGHAAQLLFFHQCLLNLPYFSSFKGLYAAGEHLPEEKTCSSGPDASHLPTCRVRLLLLGVM